MAGGKVTSPTGTAPDRYVYYPGTEELGKDSGSDEKNHKATYPALMGIERAKSKAQGLLNDALSSIQIFGDKSKTLEALARFIVERKS